MEKAWAKFNGNYKSIMKKDGWSEGPLRFFTATPTQKYFINSLGIFNTSLKDWSTINKYNGTSHIMLGATRGYNGLYLDPSHTPIGLFRSHVYNILATYNVTWANGTRILLYKIKNPNGPDDIFSGYWADNSYIWRDPSQTFAKQVGFVKDYNDGILFIDYNEFN